MPELEVLPMKSPTSIYCTAADKALMREGWQKGESLRGIERHFGHSHSSIRGVLPPDGRDTAAPGPDAG
jgi:hypothetical protein